MHIFFKNHSRPLPRAPQRLLHLPSKTMIDTPLPPHRHTTRVSVVHFFKSPTGRVMGGAAARHQANSCGVRHTQAHTFLSLSRSRFTPALAHTHTHTHALHVCLTGIPSPFDPCARTPSPPPPMPPSHLLTFLPHPPTHPPTHLPTKHLPHPTPLALRSHSEALTCVVRLFSIAVPPITPQTQQHPNLSTPHPTLNRIHPIQSPNPSETNPASQCPKRRTSQAPLSLLILSLVARPFFFVAPRALCVLPPTHTLAASSPTVLLFAEERRATHKKVEKGKGSIQPFTNGRDSVRRP